MPAALAATPTHSGPFAEDLALLLRANPIPDAKRWEQAKRDAVEFLADWGDLAAELGWSSEDLFGLHPVAPLARYDAMGLIWLLQGQEVGDVSETAARIGATVFYRTVK